MVIRQQEVLYKQKAKKSQQSFEIEIEIEMVRFRSVVVRCTSYSKRTHYLSDL